MKLPFHSQTSTMQPLKFGNGLVISSHTLCWMLLLIHPNFKVLECCKRVYYINEDVLFRERWGLNSFILLTFTTFYFLCSCEFGHIFHRRSFRLNLLVLSNIDWSALATRPNYVVRLYFRPNLDGGEGLSLLSWKYFCQNLDDGLYISPY